MSSMDIPLILELHFSAGWPWQPVWLDFLGPKPFVFQLAVVCLQFLALLLPPRHLLLVFRPTFGISCTYGTLDKLRCRISFYKWHIGCILHNLRGTPPPAEPAWGRPMVF